MVNLRRRVLANSPHKATASGSIATFQTAVKLPMKVTGQIVPVQDLHGQSNSYPAGGGKNKLDFAGLSNTESNFWYKDVCSDYHTLNAFVLEAGVTYTFSINVSTSVTPFLISVGCGNGKYSVDITSTAYNLQNGRVSVTFTPTAEKLASGNIFAFRAPRYGTQQSSITFTISDAQLELGSLATAYAPYENICPITGWTGANTTRTGANVWGGEKMADDMVAAVNDAATCQKGSDANGNYVTLTAGSAMSNKLLSNCKFKEKTAYTFIITAKKTSTNRNANLLIKYTDGTVAWCNFPENFLADTIYTFAVVSNVDKTIMGIVGSWASATTYFYYNDCGICEGVLTTADFKAYQATTKLITFALGKNLLNLTAYNGIPCSADVTELIDKKFDTTLNNKQFTDNNDGTFSISLGANETFSLLVPIDYEKIKWNVAVSSDSAMRVNMCGLDENFVASEAGTNSTGRTSFTITWLFNYGWAKYICLSFTNINSSTQTITFTNPQVEQGKTITAYEPYNGTVYGGYYTINEDGSVDLVVDRAKVKGTDITWTLRNSGESYPWVRITGLNYYYDSKDRLTARQNFICNKVRTAANSGSNVPQDAYEYGIWAYDASTVRIYLHDGDTITEATDFMADCEICYKLATPITYHLGNIGQLKSLKGINNVWSDTGDVSVEYWKL